jgi:hypothetical protein
MTSSQPALFRAAFYRAFGSVLSILFSIAISQILLALAVLLLSGAKRRLPPVWVPLERITGAMSHWMTFGGEEI